MGAKETEAVTYLEKKVKALPAEGASYDETCQTAIAALQVGAGGRGRSRWWAKAGLRALLSRVCALAAALEARACMHA